MVLRLAPAAQFNLIVMALPLLNNRDRRWQVSFKAIGSPADEIS